MKFLKYYYYFIGYYVYIQYHRLIFAQDDPARKLYNVDLYALLMHHSIRQTYDGKPYFYHVKQVALNVCKYKHLLKDSQLEQAYVGALLHDAIEDCNLTYNDIKKDWGLVIADIVYACTELKGKNRKERHGQEYFDTLKVSYLGTFVKVCDILANVEQSIKTGNSMLKAYKKEWPKVEDELYTEEFDELFTDVKMLLRKNG